MKSLLRKRMVHAVCPCLTPFLRLIPAVPVGGVCPAALIPAVCFFKPVSVLIKDIFFPAFRSPFSGLFQRAHCKHDVRVWVAVLHVMDGKIGAHPG